MARTTSDERRGQIAEAMIRVMARRGYERATVAEVAREAGLAPGLLHYHFESKQEILLAAVDRLGEAALARVEAAGAGKGPAIERLGAVVDALLARGTTADRSAVACWVAAGAEAVEQPEVREAFERATALLLAPLEALLGEASPSLSPRDRRAAAAAVLAAVHGYFVLAFASPSAIPPGSAAPSVRALVRALLSPSPVPSPGRAPAPASAPKKPSRGAKKAGKAQAGSTRKQAP